MKIALIIYGSIDTLSGGYLYDRHLVAYLRSAGCKVDILSLPWRNYGAHLTDNFNLIWANTIVNSDYDLILEDELNHPSLISLNCLLRRSCPSPIIAIVHHLRSSETHPPGLMLPYRAIERLYLQSVDGFIYNSQTTRQTVEELMGYQMPYVVAYPAADHRHPPEHTVVVNSIGNRLQQGRKLQMLFIGNLIPRKCLHIVLDACALLGTDNWCLHVAGSQEADRQYSSAMRQKSATLALDPHLVWHGRISDDQLRWLLTDCDLLVMPSYEGFGIVFLEAMAFGLPVLAANVGAAAEIVSPQVNGYLTAQDDAIALSGYMDLLKANRVHLASLAYFARQRYDRHPTWNQSMHGAFLWLCEAKAQPSREHRL